MSNRLNLLRELSQQTSRATPDDLQHIVSIHDEMCALTEGVESDIAERRPSVMSRAAELSSLSEGLVLRTHGDPVGAMQQLREGLEGLINELAAAGSDSDPAPSLSPENKAQASAVRESGTHATPFAPDEVTEQTLRDDDLPLVAEFITEAGQHLESAEASLLRLEDNPSDTEAINAVFRSFHTIKGVAGFLGLKQVTHLAHTTENLLDLVRVGKLSLSQQAIELVLAAMDSMGSLVGRLHDALRTGDMVVKGDSSIYPLIRSTETFINSGGDANTPPPARKGSEQSSPVSLAEPTGMPVPAVKSSTPEVRGSDATETPGHNASQGSGKGSSLVSADGVVKVSTARLDALINMVGEMVIAQAMVAQSVKTQGVGDGRLTRDVVQLGKISRELQAISMSMRMVPLAGVFQKMSRLVRDLAKKMGKEIELTVEGGETELDRNLVEAITDPLVHMVRNSADHGIEMPDDRVAAGKPATGRVTLRAYNQGGSIVIEIEDDGRGLNKSKLLKKAIAAGIVSEGQTLSESEIFKLIFHPGLSTAEKVTDVSGRGVGMDVVKKNVESLRGRIEITSTEGKGATFSIRLPLTLAVIDGLVVRVGDERFIVPILCVEQSIRPEQEQLSTVQGRGEMCRVRDRLLPIYRLHRLLRNEGDDQDATKSIGVVVQDDSRRCCLLVDELLGQQQVVIKSLGDGLGRLPGFSGGAILGDGNVSLILDVPSLMDLASRN